MKNLKQYVELRAICGGCTKDKHFIVGRLIAEGWILIDTIGQVSLLGKPGKREYADEDLFQEDGTD